MNFAQLSRIAAATAVVHKTFGAGLTVLPLIKVLYLTDREMIAEEGVSLTGDTYLSMKNGPVLSGFYDLLKGDYHVPSIRDAWKIAFTVEKDASGKLGKIYPNGAIHVKTLNRNEVEKLRKYSLEALQVFRSGGSFSDWIHEKCPEWEPTNGSKPLSLRKMLESSNPALAVKHEYIRQRIETEFESRSYSGFERKSLMSVACGA